MKNNYSSTIIIPTFNSEKYLSRTLRCLETQTDKDFLVLIIDDRSVDKTVSIARSFKELKLEIISKSSTDIPGAAASLNTAFSKIDTPFFALIDSDAYLARNWVSSMKEMIQLDENIIGAPILAYEKNSRAGYLAGLEIESRYEKIGHGAHLSHLSTCNLFGKTALLDDIKLNIHLSYAYDHQLSYLLGQKRIQFYFNNRTSCTHNNKSSFGAYFKQQFKIASYHLALAIKYPLQASKKDRISPSLFALQPILVSLAIASIFVNPYLIIVFILLLVLSNIYFFGYLVRHKHQNLLFGAIVLTLIRAIAWLPGLFWGVIKFFQL